jgi:hypothetical protein
VFRKAIVFIGGVCAVLALGVGAAGAAVVDNDHLSIEDPNGRWSITEHWFGAQAAVTWNRETGFDQVTIRARLNEALFNNSASCAEVRVRSFRTDGTTATTRTRTCAAMDLNITHTAQGRRLSSVRVQLFEIHSDCIDNNQPVENCYGGLGGGYGGVLNRLIGTVSRAVGD